MKFKQLAAVGLVTAMVFSTAGCSSKSQQTESSAAQAEKTSENSQEKAQGGEPVEIVYLNSHADVWEGDVGKEIIQKFEESHPGIKVKTESYPFDQMIEMVEVKMKSKLSDFDVLNVDAPLVTSYSVRGYLEPFENYMSRDELDKVFTQTGLNAAAYDGKVMTAPKRESGMIMVYNKDILDENNIPYPAYETDKRMTWEECLDICRQVTKVENGSTTCWGILISVIITSACPPFRYSMAAAASSKLPATVHSSSPSTSLHSPFLIFGSSSTTIALMSFPPYECRVCRNG